MRRDYALTGQSRDEMIYDKQKLLELGGTHEDRIKKWAKKEKNADAQETFPVDKSTNSQ